MILQPSLAAAIAAEQSGRADEAERLYRRLATEAEPADALNRLGVLLAQQGRHAEALDHLQEAVEAAPARPDIRFNLALAHQLAGDLEGARIAYGRLLEAAPEHAEGWGALGQLLTQMEAPPEEAAEAFERALALRPDHAAARLGLGVSRQRAGDLAAALAAFRAAYAAAPGDRAALGNLAAALLDGGDAKAAAGLLQSQPETAGDPDLLNTLAAALLDLGETRASLATLRRALELAPGHTRVLGQLALAFAALGEAAPLARFTDYDGLTSLAALPLPAGWPDRAAFHAALTEEILADPDLRYARPGKTTRGGRQSGNLLRQPGPAVADLATAIDKAVQSYLAAPRRPLRPWGLPQRRTVLWATLLDGGGHQDPHNHPSGLLSGVYYVALPDGGGEAGALVLGQVPRRLANRCPLPRRLVRPSPGDLLLFPSWMWHATVPTEGTARRMSLAFDVGLAPPPRRS